MKFIYYENVRNQNNFCCDGKMDPPYPTKLHYPLDYSTTEQVNSFHFNYVTAKHLTTFNTYCSGYYFSLASVRSSAREDVGYHV